ncbi:MAG: 2-C-methyl-D-erythritol 2,4-cyclodiphosphate synthase [Oligosphaeraceae bacterium]
MDALSLRIGQGYDIHPLREGRPFRLGGVTLPHPANLGPQGHSDGDPLLHALMDAILGSAALGDLGDFFPDRDSRWKDADSAQLLQRLLQDPRLRQWRLVNLDATIFLASPPLAPFLPLLKTRLAELLQASPRQISLKAKSGNGQGEIGRGEALAAQVVLLAQLPPPSPIA